MPRWESRRMPDWLAAKSAALEAAERQGVCSSCSQPLRRPLNPRRPDICGACDRASILRHESDRALWDEIRQAAWVLEGHTL